MTSLCVIASSLVPPGIRGSLNQWMVEVLPGIYIGRVTARLRDEIWSRLSLALEEDGEAYAMLAFQTNNEQGYELLRIGDHRYEVNDFDGLQLVTVTHRSLSDKTEPLLSEEIE